MLKQMNIEQHCKRDEGRKPCWRKRGDKRRDAATSSSIAASSLLVTISLIHFPSLCFGSFFFITYFFLLLPRSIFTNCISFMLLPSFLFLLPCLLLPMLPPALQVKFLYSLPPDIWSPLFLFCLLLSFPFLSLIFITSLMSHHSSSSFTQPFLLPSPSFLSICTNVTFYLLMFVMFIHVPFYFPAA